MQVQDVRLRQLALRCIKGQSSAREGASLEPALLGAVSQSGSKEDVYPLEMIHDDKRN
jgi:hypothetical protein